MAVAALATVDLEDVTKKSSQIEVDFFRPDVEGAAKCLKVKVVLEWGGGKLDSFLPGCGACKGDVTGVYEED